MPRRYQSDGADNVNASRFMSENHEFHVTKSNYEQGRTAYHFQPPHNWLNDPNGPMYYKGVYHLFYQYNPYGAVFHKPIIWAHSVSYDLVNWIHLNHAILPSKPFDINSCWSGSSTILPGGKPVILYTGLDARNQQVQNLAMPKNMSDPFLREWVKYDNNPVMAPTNGIKPDNFRDPSTAWKGKDGIWRVIVGGLRNNRGVAALYRSRDFVRWTISEAPLYSGKNNGIWECPDFYPVFVDSKAGVENSVVRGSNVKYVVKASFDTHDFYTIGSYVYDEDKFVPDHNIGNGLDLRYDYGKFYASKTFFDSAKNRRILWGWINESDSVTDDIRKGWSGIQSTPHSIFLDKNGRQLIQWPAEEIETLRGKHVSFSRRKLGGYSSFEVSGITASQADVDVTFKLPEVEEAEPMDTRWVDPQLLCSEKTAMTSGKVGPFGLLAMASHDLREHTAIFFRVFTNDTKFIVLMCSDQSRSSLRAGIDKTTYGAFVNTDIRNGMISLRSLIDHSVIESFGEEGRACITARVYPTLSTDKSARLFVFNNGTLDVIVSRLDAWNMNQAKIN